MPFRLRLFHRLLKFVSRKNLEQLVHDAAKSFHGAVPPADLSVRRTKIYHRNSASFQTRVPPAQHLIWTEVPREEGWTRHKENAAQPPCWSGRRTQSAQAR